MLWIKIINKIIIKHCVEKDASCKWSQLQRVFLNVMRAFEFQYGKQDTYEETSGTRAHNIFPPNILNKCEHRKYKIRKFKS